MNQKSSIVQILRSDPRVLTSDRVSDFVLAAIGDWVVVLVLDVFRREPSGGWGGAVQGDQRAALGAVCLVQARRCSSSRVAE